MVADPPWARVRVLGCPVPPELCAEDARLPVAPPEREQWTEFKQVVREDQMPYETCEHQEGGEPCSPAAGSPPRPCSRVILMERSFLGHKVLRTFIYILSSQKAARTTIIKFTTLLHAGWIMAFVVRQGFFLSSFPAPRDLFGIRYDLFDIT